MDFDDLWFLQCKRREKDALLQKAGFFFWICFFCRNGFFVPDEMDILPLRVADNHRDSFAFWRQCCVKSTQKQPDL